MSIKDLLRITPEEREKMMKMRKRTPEELEKDVEILKDWWKKQAHLPNLMEINKSSVPFVDLLVHNKYSLEKTKSKIEFYYASPHMFPEFFKDRQPFHPRIQQIFKSVIYVPLPKLTPDLGRISIIKPLATEYEIDNEASLMRMLMVADLRIKEDHCLTEHTIVDLKNQTLSNSLKVNPINVKKFFTIVEKGYSDSVASIHILNMPSFTMSLVGFIKSLMKEKFISRVHIHEKETELLNFFPKEILPKDYGGDERSLQELQDDWTKVMESHKDFFADMSIRQSNEKLRVGQPPKNDFVGVEGSFRQLTVD